MASKNYVVNAVSLSRGTSTVVAEGIVVARRESGDLVAFRERCPHTAGPLGDGDIIDDAVRCPWHHYKFSLESGACLTKPGSIWANSTGPKRTMDTCSSLKIRIVPVVEHNGTWEFSL